MDGKEIKSKPKQSKGDAAKAKLSQNESTADESVEIPAKKQKKKKVTVKHGAGKKHAKPVRDVNAPKYPFTGYVRFSNERREELKKLCPEMTVLEVTKKMAEEWNTMEAGRKKPFLEAADIDKQRYSLEMKEYQEKKKKEGIPTPSTKKVKRKKNSTFNGNTTSTSCGSDTLNSSFSSTNTNDKPKNGPPTVAAKPANQRSLVQPPPPPQAQPPSTLVALKQNGDIPIFTDQFLEHNRRIESELRQLRKSNTDYEQQNSVLEKHVENMTNGIAKLQRETEEISQRNEIVEQYLQQLRLKLANALSGLSIPNKPGGANNKNIDTFMDDLFQMATSNSHGPASLNKAKDILRKLDLNIQV